MVGWLDGWLAGWLVGWMVSWLVESLEVVDLGCQAVLVWDIWMWLPSCGWCSLDVAGARVWLLTVVAIEEVLSKI